MKNSILKMYILFLVVFIPVLAPAEDMKSLDEYLRSHGFNLSPTHSHNNEGYMSDYQKEQFIENLKIYPEINRIAEIGLNGGHSAEMFFSACKDLTMFVSFDLNQHPYTPIAVEFFNKKYGSRFIFNAGDSIKTVPQFHFKNPDLSFDLIFIDGCHLFEWAMADIINMKKMAHSRTVLWIDDVPPDLSGTIGQAVIACEQQGIIKVINIHYSNHPIHGERSWVEAEFLFQ